MADLAGQRLASQRLVSPQPGSAADVVRWMGAVQAQDRPGAMWALALRMRQPRPEDIERSIARGDLVRTWPMRGTLHLVPGEDARWMLDLLAPRARRRSAARLRALRISDADLARAAKTLEAALAGGARLTRPEAYATLDAAGVATRGQRGIHILGELAQRGLLCLGPLRGKQPTFMLLDDLVPRPRDVPQREALAELARRYFTSHGPATVRDFAWWTGLTVAAAREAARSAPGLRADGDTFAPLRLRQARPGTAHLLPAFDELFVAYKDRSAGLARLRPSEVPAAAGLLSPTVVLDGQLAGLWRRVWARGHVRITVRPLLQLDGEEREAVARAADVYGRFLGAEVALDVQRRVSPGYS